MDRFILLSSSTLAASFSAVHCDEMLLVCVFQLPLWQNLLLHSSFFQVLITKPSKASDCDEDELDDSEDDRYSSKTFDEYSDADEDDGRVEEPEMKLGVTPFLSGVLPAGRLKARTKPVGLQAAGLIQVRIF